MLIQIRWKALFDEQFDLRQTLQGTKTITFILTTLLTMYLLKTMAACDVT